MSTTTHHGSATRTRRRGASGRASAACSPPACLRALWVAPLFLGLGILLVVGGRYVFSYHPYWKWDTILTVAFLTMMPLGFLVGIGAFDYWARYAIGAPTRPEDHSDHGAKSWRDYFRVNPDHKVIGVQYLVTTIVFFVIGGLLAMIMRAELARPGLQFVDSQTFNELFSVHASLMIFLFVIPAFAGLGNYVIPLMIGAPDMAFPRLNALSFWLLPIAGIMMVSSFAVPGFGCGWTGYAPLCSSHQGAGRRVLQHGRPVGGRVVDHDRAQLPGHDHHDAGAGDDLLAHAAARLGELHDVDAGRDRDAVHRRLAVLRRCSTGSCTRTSSSRRRAATCSGYQHIFWFYSHPAVYIMMLPGFGIASEVISVMARKPIFGYRLMAFSLMAILVLGFSVWAHHMFVAGVAPWLRIPMMVDLDADRGTDRDQGVLLARDHVGGQDPLRDADAVRARLHLDVRDRRPVRDLPRRGADRHPRLGHVLRRRAHPLRAVRRLAVHDLRGDLLLVPEDDRAGCTTSGSASCTSG